MGGDLSRLGSTAKGIGVGIEAGARGIDRLVARLEDVVGFHAIAVDVCAMLSDGGQHLVENPSPEP